MGLTDYQEDVVTNITLVFGSISLVCSVLTLMLIYYSKKWNGYLLLLTSLTCCQIIYDLNYILRVIHNKYGCQTTQFLDLIGGLGVSFWTNILAFVVCYTILYNKSINIFKKYKYFSIFATGVPVFIALVAISLPDTYGYDDDGGGYDCYYQDNPRGNSMYGFYYWSRLISIIITIILCSITFIRVKRMAIGTGTKSSFASTSEVESQAIFHTVIKMNYYAVAQAVCRSGAAWDEWNYGQYSTFPSSVIAAICSPSTGLYNFIIFLIMLPNAFQHFKALICCKSINKTAADLPPTTPQEGFSRGVMSFSDTDSSTTFNDSESFAGDYFQPNPLLATRQQSEDMVPEKDNSRSFSTTMDDIY